MNVYLMSGDRIQYSQSIGWGARQVTTCKRVPKPVRELLKEHPHHEVTYDAKHRTAALVPVWDRVHGW